MPEISKICSHNQGKKKYEGNQCSKILKNVTIIENEIPEQFQEFIEVLDAFNEVKFTTYGNSLSYCSPRPPPYYKNVVKFFEDKTIQLQQKYKVTIPNEWHYVIYHVPEYVDKNNWSLGKTSDQLIVNSTAYKQNF